MNTRDPTRPLETSRTRPGREFESPIGPSRIGKLLLAELDRLEGIRAAMAIEGLDEEAGSVVTTIADLRWQYEELEGRLSDGSNNDEHIRTW